MIALKDLTKSIDGKVLFKDLSLVIQDGARLGIIGPNGAGKSTLLKIIADKQQQDSGEIQRENENIGYLAQQMDEEGSTLILDYLEADINPSVWQELGKMNLGDIDVSAPLKSLSGGQKTKVAFAKVLSKKPTILLLDEPTNHLDIKSIAHLESVLVDYRGTVVIVSHDRAFLNATVNEILSFDPANDMVERFQGNYDMYAVEYKKAIERKHEAYNRQQKQKKKMEEWLALKRQEASVYTDPAKGKQVRMMERRIQREIYDQKVLKPQASKTLKKAGFEGSTHSGKLMIRAENLAKNYGDKLLFCDVGFEVRGDERIVITGDNGTGKSTLLKILLGQIKPDEGTVTIGEGVKLGYFSQNQDTLSHENAVMEEFIATQVPQNPARARAILGSFLFIGDDIDKKVSVLSYGERTRLAMAKLMNQKNHILMLDEPTNHLDIPSRNAIEKALQEYEGAFIVVSHDRFFLEQIQISRKLRLLGWGIEEK